MCVYYCFRAVVEIPCSENEIQQSHGSETWNFRITFFMFFLEMSLQENVKTYSRTMTLMMMEIGPLVIRNASCWRMWRVPLCASRILHCDFASPRRINSLRLTVCVYLRCLFVWLPSRQITNFITGVDPYRFAGHTFGKFRLGRIWSCPPIINSLTL